MDQQPSEESVREETRVTRYPTRQKEECQLGMVEMSMQMVHVFVTKG